MKIGIDIDGTIYPWTRAANEAVMQEFGIADPGPHTQWDHLKLLLPDDQFRWIWSYEAANAVFGRLDLIEPHAARVINDLARRHEVHFVTHRNPHKTAVATAAWVSLHFEGYRGLHVLDNSVKKYTVLDFDVFVDDKPETVDEFVALTNTWTLMPQRDWNVHYQDADAVFTDWQYVPDMLKGAEADACPLF